MLESVPKEYRIFPLGDAAVTIEFGKIISIRDNQTAIAVAEFFDLNPFPGYIESAPAYASTTIFYDVGVVRRTLADAPSAFEAVRQLIVLAVENVDDTPAPDGRFFDIPAVFNEQSGPDTADIARANHLSASQVIDLFTAATYRVFMLGFLPGFAYMGEVDERIAMSRKTSPRLLVPKGSIGIAGRQTGIYSLESPGGWQIVGRTDVELFTPNKDSPSLLRPGDQVRFIARK